ncbi:unnamed protein product [Amoebophrya sp. A25]|nr:unnamed protein product [Amoebophrya sp. A25]|eukprot:GSA25T00025848001.1
MMQYVRERYLNASGGRCSSPWAQPVKVVTILAKRLTSVEGSPPDPELEGWMRHALFGKVEYNDIHLTPDELQRILSPEMTQPLEGITGVRLWVDRRGDRNPESALLEKQIMADVALTGLAQSDATVTRWCNGYPLAAFLYYRDVEANDEAGNVVAQPERKTVLVSKSAKDDGREVGIVTMCTEDDVSRAVPKVAAKVLPGYLQRNWLHRTPGKTGPPVLEWRPIEPEEEFAQKFYRAIQEDGEIGCTMPATWQRDPIFKMTEDSSSNYFSLKLQRRVLIGEKETTGVCYDLMADYSCSKDGTILLELRPATAPHGQTVALPQGNREEDFCWQERTPATSALELPRASLRKTATSATSSTYDYPSTVVPCGLFAVLVVAVLCLLLRAALRRARPTEAAKSLRALNNKIDAEAGEEGEVFYGAARMDRVDLRV